MIHLNPFGKRRNRLYTYLQTIQCLPQLVICFAFKNLISLQAKLQFGCMHTLQHNFRKPWFKLKSIQFLLSHARCLCRFHYKDRHDEMISWYWRNSTLKSEPRVFFLFSRTNLLPCSKKVAVSSASAHKKYHRTANTELTVHFLFLPFLGKDKSVEWHNTGYRKMPQKTNLYQSIILLYFALFLSSWTEPLIWAYIYPSHEPL